jgi:hypothetical protein
MAGNSGSREAKAWAVILALLAVGVGVVVYLQQAERERRQRQEAMEYFRRTPPDEHIENLKRVAGEKAEREARGEK